MWIDLISPTVQEDKLVEKLLGIAVPTREEMQEIEVSSRLYVENGARYMTATLMCQSDTATPKTTPVTFILSGHRLCTVRYDEPRPFAIVENKLARTCPPKVSGERRADGSARRGDRPLRRHPGAHRRRGRPDLAFDLRAGRRTPSRRPTTTCSRRSAARATSPRKCARARSRSAGCCRFSPRSRRHEMDQGRARAVAVDAARRDLAHGSRQLSLRQDHLPARRHARRGQHPAEQHHQDISRSRR